MRCAAIPSDDLIRAVSFALVSISLIDVALGIPLSHILMVTFSAAVFHVCHEARLFSNRQLILFISFILISALFFYLLLSSSMAIFAADSLLVCHILYQIDLKRIPLSPLLSAVLFDYLLSYWLRYFPSPIFHILISISLALSLISILCLCLGHGYDIAPYLTRYRRLLHPQPKLIARPPLDYAKSAPVRLSDKNPPHTLIKSIDDDGWAAARGRLEKGDVFVKHTKGSARSRFVKLNVSSSCLEWWMPDSSALIGQTPIAALTGTDRDGTRLSIQFVTRTLTLQAATADLAVQWHLDLGLLLQYKLDPICG